MNKVDLLFIVDITGSMGGFIQQAKEKMHEILNSLSEEFKIDLQVGLSLYRDHPSQGDDFVTAVFELQLVDKIKSKIDLISVGGGGDEPEAIIDGIIDGVKSMNWREKSRRIAFLIGDASAHGMLNDECCTCGKTWGEAISEVESKKVSIYSIVLGNSQRAKLCFKTLSNFTGGILIESTEAMKAITETLRQEFDNLNLDSQILEMMSKNLSEEEISKMLKIDREEISESKSRLAQVY
jgi:hypothetical protein